MVERKLVTVTSTGPLPEAGGIYGPIPPTRLPMSVIRKMVSRDRNIYECDPKAPTDSKRWIPLNMMNYDKNNFKKEDLGRGNKSNPVIYDEMPFDSKKGSAEIGGIDESYAIDPIKSESIPEEESSVKNENPTMGTIFGDYGYQTDPNTRKVYEVSDSINISDQAVPSEQGESKDDEKIALEEEE